MFQFQPFQMNLLVSSIFTKLAAAPSPVFHCLFDPNSTHRNVYTILKQVTSDNLVYDRVKGNT